MGLHFCGPWRSLLVLDHMSGDNVRDLCGWKCAGSGAPLPFGQSSEDDGMSKCAEKARLFVVQGEFVLNGSGAHRPPSAEMGPEPVGHSPVLEKHSVSDRRLTFVDQWCTA